MNLVRLSALFTLIIGSQLCLAQTDFKGKVKRVTQTTYYRPTGDTVLKKENVTSTRTRKWDRSGHLLSNKEIHNKIAGVTDTNWKGGETCVYNKKGQLVERRFSDLFVQRSRSKRKYDINGRLSDIHWQWDFSTGEKSIGHEEHIYNEAGKKVQVLRFENDSTTPRSTTYYGESERMDSVISFRKDNTVAGCTHVRYDASGNEVERLLNNDRRWTYQFNDKGQKVEENSWRGHVVYKYDDKGNEVEAVKYDDNGRFHDAVTKTYNDKGYLIKVSTDNRDPSPANTYYAEDEYTDFDEAGNYLKATERHITKRKDKTLVTVYKIEYYSE